MKRPMSTTGLKPSTGPKKVAGVAVTSKRVTILVIVVAAICSAAD
jgi:hypothetical protein